MEASQDRTAAEGPDAPSFDRWLRLDPASAARFEREAGPARALHLRYIIWFGLALYNLYNITGALLMPDIAAAASVLRIGVVTPVSLLLSWAVVHLPARWRERLTLMAMFNAHLLPAVLFSATRAEFGAYSFAELTLTLVYGNMLMALHFRHAVVFTGLGVLVTLAALVLKPGLPPPLHVALAVQIVTAGIFSLFANYLMERRRCSDYVAALSARYRAERAEIGQRSLALISQTDALTGLPNRRYLDETLTRWCAGPHRVAVLMIDVDHFKRYNDTLGHPAGDDCLRRLALTFRDSIPRDDAFCARFGGEEFTIALRNAPVDAAEALAGLIARKVKALAISHPGRDDGIAIVTVSIGITAGHVWADPGELLTQSDMALYRAKESGRDRIETCPAPPHRARRAG